MTEFWTASYVLLWLIVAGLCFIVMGLLRQFGLIQLRLGPEPGVLITKEGLERGTPAPDFALVDVQSQNLIRLPELDPLGGLPRSPCSTRVSFAHLRVMSSTAAALERRGSAAPWRDRGSGALSWKRHHMSRARRGLSR